MDLIINGWLAAARVRSAMSWQLSTACDGPDRYVVQPESSQMDDVVPADSMIEIIRPLVGFVRIGVCFIEAHVLRQPIFSPNALEVGPPDYFLLNGPCSNQPFHRV